MPTKTPAIKIPEDSDDIVAETSEERSALEAATGWCCSRLDNRRAIQSCADKVYFAVQFARYRADGSVIGRFPSMWVVTLCEGRWGIAARSSFAPRPAVRSTQRAPRDGRITGCRS